MLKPDRYGILEFKLGSNDKNHKIPIENAYKDMTVPDILTIRIEKDGEVNDVVVEVENRAIEKPYIGGYKDAHTDILYHHGYTQTGPPKPKVPPELKNHRDTQTYFTRNRRTEQDYSRATQVTTKGIYLPNACDRILTPGPYETADERERRIDIEGKVRTIQRYYRAWMMRKKLKEFSDEYQKRLRIALEREEKERIEDAKRRKKDLVDKVFPVKTEDFAMLYSMVDRWKKSEIERITSIHCGPSKIAEFYLLLEKEIEIIQSIERLRTKVNKDVEKKQIIDFFKAIGSPIEWDSDYKHIHISMDTMEAQKGREYFRLYQRLCDQKATKEDRLQTYLDIKLYLNTHKCNERQEIISLIDRMCEFLARGMSESSLKVLQKRIEALILHHFKMTECNEGVTSHPNKLRIKQMTKNLIYCQMCQKMKAIEQFTINARSERIKICTACMWLDKAEEPWVDLSPYKFILRQIRNYERLHHGTSSIAFIMQDRDIQFIVTVIWHGHSALSECADVYQLRLVRWDTEQEWSPWNCILLTMEEAKAHLRLDRLNDMYEQEFRNHIFNKHALARKHFKNLSSYDKHFTEFSKGDWKLDEWSDYYSRPNKHECDIEIEENKEEEGEKSSNSNGINSEDDDECTCKKIFEKSTNSEELNE
ncbi:LOW QUALITY PROTEIN: IQ and ubiquitin-like domain-containing protein [Sitophilus oryzae]|uniref:LOW QUALITY PROTEIN: IQ and ubiquitin-like domain-containing protein n=1 Tax=Sitophilus oryzae TaxID=7048 RepID=A0A6J2YYS4_SITOR|nr:LOW QUALITY PROTEIN: IQ and ubiquitin-like domain-containing protein [Sitophilus oryzae]